jgi:aspartyl-tRNA(Asn)/glutamyl-tRNA(Gln) amidotransferase subunit C
MNKVKITKEEVKKLALLSKIELQDDEIEQFTEDMQTIISSVETLDNFQKDTGINIKGRQLAEKDFSELRDDVVQKSLPKENVLSNAPNQENGYFKIYEDSIN